MKNLKRSVSGARGFKMSIILKPKDFIKITLIEEMKDVVMRHPYLAFALISTGIEFLGKCMLTELDHWGLTPEERKSKKFKPFDKGMELMTIIDDRYAHINIKDQLLNGFAHNFSPKTNIALSEVKHGAKHFEQIDNKKILVIEIFYRDFVRACNAVLNYTFNENDKMNIGLLSIPENSKIF